ncbi:2-oxoisovalerate dehydrogenase E2 component (dihydrolipoyl transacylase) [Mesorhizobium sp. J18]|uniref:dihydrolipoamide acetyltransferase family protein n=1 Tax=Mesorhizobium sp. J18 TaxID=935263 RepID=UPI0011998B59|nr:dihydrolipoamide acetyltransferase family protein [Mesorhizobium sp. J18]TWG96404.1 2-oxoisovalerate dehydrogenase E2 component (dihydrolipoyl transacylase) [Mesorhizobium sp. J18]
MGEHVIKLPDVGEGVAEAELVEWHVRVGDLVREDAIVAAVMTDKATVEIPTPVEGKILWLVAEIGSVVAVGSPIVRIETAGDDAGPEPVQAQPEAAPTAPSPAPSVVAEPVAPAPAKRNAAVPSTVVRRTGLPRPEGEKPLASPAVRQRAREAGIDLRQVHGTGPAGRIGHQDIDAFIARGTQPPALAGMQRRLGVEEIKVVGLRRRIAEKMVIAKTRIPHITYVEEVDVTDLESVREKLNARKRSDQVRLTIMPFLMRAMVKAITEQPAINATFDDDAGIIHRHAPIHIGIATQTAGGLMVPVVEHAEARDLFDCATEAARVSEAARNGSATREELSGSTITITSLGAMGGIATTPVINHPEVAIVGVNKIAVRPSWDGTQFVPRKMMNLSSSFDHRIIDGWEAAIFVQRLKALLETPALIFVEG